MNNDKEDLFLEFWGESDRKRYFIGINSTTGEDIYFGDDKIRQIETNLNSIYHESIIISNDNENNIFSINSYYFEFINIKENNFSYEITDKIVGFENIGSPGFRNSIIKLKDNNYLSAIVIYKNTLGYKHHKLYISYYNFISNDMNGFNQIKNADIKIDYLNSTTCFQTESFYIQCSYNRVLELSNDVFCIGIYNSDLDEKRHEDISYVNENSFIKAFHIKNDIGAYIYFDRDTNLPNIKIKSLIPENNFELKNVFDFESIVLNGNGKYTFSFNNGLFFSDGIKINVSKFVVILTKENLLNLLICVFDLYNDDTSLRLRYFYLDLEKINIKIDINLRIFKFGNFFGLLFYNSNLEYPGYAIFNYPNLNNHNNYINNTKIEIKLFTDLSCNSFSFLEIIMINNIFGEEIDKIKIINFTESSISGIKINSSNLNSELYINEELDIDDQLIFYPSESGAYPGKYILYFSPIIREPNNDDDESFSDLIVCYGNTSQNSYEPKKYKGNTFRLIYEIECHEKYKTCSQLGTDSNYYCVKCSNEYPYKVNNGEKCDDKCDNYIFLKENEKFCNIKCTKEQFIYIKKENENEKYCVDNCNNNQFKYYLNENEKYCLLACIFNNEELYLDIENKICYKNFSQTNEEIIQTAFIESYNFDDINENIKSSIIDDVNAAIESSIIDNINTAFESSIINNIDIVNESSIVDYIKTDIESPLFKVIRTEVETNNNINSEIEIYSQIEIVENSKSKLHDNNDINSIIQN